MSSNTDVDRGELRAAILVKAKKQRLYRLTATLLALACIILVGAYLVIKAQPEPIRALTTDQLPKGARSDDFGIAVGVGPVIIDEYFDFLCPACGEVEKAIHRRVQELIDSGQVTVVYHPMGKLDEYSTPPGFSTRAVVAAGCAADQGLFDPYRALLMSKQPVEKTPGWDDSQLAELITPLGGDHRAMRSCIDSKQYLTWAKATLERAETQVRVYATPTILVDGRPISADPNKVLAELNASIK